MSLDLAFRLIGTTLMAGLGARFGVTIADTLSLNKEASTFLFLIAGALVGITLTPWITTRPAQTVRRAILDSDAETLLSSMLGLVFGLVVGGLLAYPLSLLPNPAAQFFPAIFAVGFAYLFVGIFALRTREIFGLFKSFSRGSDSSFFPVEQGEILLDTSVIIDGRILDLSQTGFVAQKLVIPQFVIHELQHIADSSDTLRRQRGRHGLDVLSKLKQESLVPVEIDHEMPAEGNTVDEKLVVLASQRGVAIMTNDYNLNKTAEVQGVFVLNINDLSMALRPVYLPGEVINLHIIQEGKEESQGVGYLIDGTMVVVEDGRRYRDRTVPVRVTRYILSSAGKMYFAQPAFDD
ncbi:MAG: PIN domain-containing protein [Chloroflexi bacterium]|nr:PIN domain-containing protein [Chloroflexota bacterium]